MPGITGIIGLPSAEQAANVLDEMVKCMRYEPFYSSGTLVNGRLGLCVGWVCHKGPFSDCLPAWNEARDICVIVTGEEFRSRDDVVALRRGGHECPPGTAGYLVRLYEAHGTGCFERLNGWFSGVVVDLRAATVHVFNDRYGLSRIYYHEEKEALYFSSEAKAILRVLPQLRKWDLPSLAETFSCGCALGNRTLFSGISLLPGGSVWSRQVGGRTARTTYFARERWEDQPSLDPATYFQKLRDAFTQALPGYLRADERVAMSLTGGLDGRMIMAWAQRPAGGLPCYTFGGTVRDSADVAIAREVARICQQPHQVIAVGSEFLKQFPALAEKSVFISDGALDMTGAVELYVNRLAREIAPIRLTGNYGSEILRGNVAFKPGRVQEDLFDPDFARLVREAAKTYAEEARGHRLSFIAFKQVPWHHYSRLSIEQSQLTLRSPFLDNRLVAVAYQTPTDPGAGSEASLRLIAEGSEALSRVPTDRGLVSSPVPLLGGVRAAFQKFMFRAEYAYDEGMPQWLARIDGSLGPLGLERWFSGRHRFTRFRVWYQRELSQYLREVLLDGPAGGRPYLKKGALEKMVSSHLQARQNHTNDLHRLLACELAHRTLFQMN